MQNDVDYRGRWRLPLQRFRRFWELRQLQYVSRKLAKMELQYKTDTIFMFSIQNNSNNGASPLHKFSGNFFFSRFLEPRILNRAHLSMLTRLFPVFKLKEHKKESKVLMWSCAWCGTPTHIGFYYIVYFSNFASWNIHTINHTLGKEEKAVFFSYTVLVPSFYRVFWTRPKIQKVLLWD